MKLYRRGKIWWTWVRSPGAPVKRISTGQTDEIAARDVALALQRKAARAGANEASWKKHRDGDSSVYFIRAGADGPIKIGIANDVEARLAVIQAHNHMPIALLLVLAGGLLLEHQLHERFARYRIRGEWFFPAKELLTFIDQPETRDKL